MKVFLSQTLMFSSFFFPFLLNNGHREYKFVPTIRCHVQNAVYQLQVTKTNSDVQEQTSALKPVIIWTHIVSRGGEIDSFLCFDQHFHPLKDATCREKKLNLF